MARDLFPQLRAKFRRHSTASSLSSVDVATPASSNLGRKVARSIKSRASQRPASTIDGATIDEEKEASHVVQVIDKSVEGEGEAHDDRREPGVQLNQRSSDLQPTTADAPKLLQVNFDDNRKHDSSSTGDFPTPNTDTGIPPVPEEDCVGESEPLRDGLPDFQLHTPGISTDKPQSSQRPSELSRRQSLLPHQQTRLIKTLLETELPPQSRAANLDYFANNGPSTISANMVSRKIWVKRPGASATLVTIHEDDLVDDVRDMILKKYANSLGRSFDAPDVTLRIVPREQRQERVLGPEEPMGRTLDAYYPGGQTVDEALVIDVPLRRTPKPSPQPNRTYHDEHPPPEAGSDYFPPMPVPAIPSPHLPNVVPVNGQNNVHHGQLTSHSMSVLTTGHVPALPSPGSTRRHHRERPRIGRQHTSSPTVITTHPAPQALNNGTQVYPRGPRSRAHSSASEKSNAPPAAPPLPTPPTQQNDALTIQRVATPPPRVSSPRPQSNRPSKRSKKASAEHPSLPAGMLNGAVPPINVLIVEDNIINLKLLEAFMKRLKVRWQTAMNGREAVTKWRAGGFHLVLMDIQLPIMSGLEATKEIRRLERLNSIGVFSSSASSSAPEQANDEPEGEDKLPSTVLFKSPVIIVALTASSLQSDRHEALAAGCNDFLTKVRLNPLTTSLPRTIWKLIYSHVL
jgi:osomolarity two-component system response regulator SSK1